MSQLLFDGGSSDNSSDFEDELDLDASASPTMLDTGGANSDFFAALGQRATAMEASANNSSDDEDDSDEGIDFGALQDADAPGHSSDAGSVDPFDEAYDQWAQESAVVDDEHPTTQPDPADQSTATKSTPSPWDQIAEEARNTLADSADTNNVNGTPLHDALDTDGREEALEAERLAAEARALTGSFKAKMRKQMLANEQSSNEQLTVQSPTVPAERSRPASSSDDSDSIHFEEFPDNFSEGSSGHSSDVGDDAGADDSDSDGDGDGDGDATGRNKPAAPDDAVTVALDDVAKAMVMDEVAQEVRNELEDQQQKLIQQGQAQQVYGSGNEDDSDDAAASSEDEPDSALPDANEAAGDEQSSDSDDDAIPLRSRMRASSEAAAVVAATRAARLQTTESGSSNLTGTFNDHFTQAQQAVVDLFETIRADMTSNRVVSIVAFFSVMRTTCVRVLFLILGAILGESLQ